MVHTNRYLDDLATNQETQINVSFQSVHIQFLEPDSACV